MKKLLWLALVSGALTACDGGGKAKPDAAEPMSQDAGEYANRKLMTLEEAQDPTQCKKCHLNHYNEWASSMHAYAAKDPVFLAMNKRGQRETNGALGDFCVKCHAPMAVLAGKTTDGLNLDEVPDALKGVTCYFCHNAIDVQGEHNATVKLANDVTMRGSIRDPKQPRVHKAAFSSLFDDRSPKSSTLCGGCHDIVTPAPASVHLERTYAEYKAAAVSNPKDLNNFLTCVACHMNSHDNQLAADDPPSGVGLRTVHEHLWPGVDVALTDFPNREAQKLAVQCALGGTGAFLFEFDPGVTEPTTFKFTFETEAGHHQPSGAAQDRRMWMEYTAYDASGGVVYQRGHIADGAVEEVAEGAPGYDRDLIVYRDRLFDKDGQPTHMFWNAAPSPPTKRYPMGTPGYTQYTIPQIININATNHSIYEYVRNQPFMGPKVPVRVEAKLRMRPMGMDVLQDLVDSGDLDPAILKEVPTFDMDGTKVDWDLARDGRKPVNLSKFAPSGCPNSYLCLLQPGSSYCDTKK